MSNLHNDKYHNCFAQIVGRKYFRLYSPADATALYPHASGPHTNTSQVDVDAVDHDRFPKFRSAPYYECVLEAGELLYIPRFWWHYVRAETPSFCASFWFGGASEEHADGKG